MMRQSLAQETLTFMQARPSTPTMKREPESSVRYNGQSSLRRSDVGREGLCSNSSRLKRNLELSAPKSDMKTEEKKKKVEAQLDCSFKSRKRGSVTEKLVVDQSQKLASYDGTEEEESDDRKKRCLKLNMKYSRDSGNTIDSVRDHLSAEKDSNQLKSNVNVKKSDVDEERLHATFLSGRENLLAEGNIHQEKSSVDKERSSSSSLKFGKENMNIEKDSAKEVRHENHILSQQKQGPYDKVVRNEIDSKLNKRQRECNRQMKKLLQNQQGEIHVFHQIWEEKRLKLEKDHKLESAIIQYIHRGDSAKMDSKLSLMDGRFAKKMEENKCQKNVQLKELEVELLVAKNEERRKNARLLASVKANCSSKLKAVYGPQSLDSQSEEVNGFSQSSIQDVVPLTRLHEDKNPRTSVEGNNVAPSELPVSAPAEELGCGVPVGNSSNILITDSENEVGLPVSHRSVPAGIQQLNQLKDIGSLEITFSIPASVKILPGKVPPGLPETLPNEINDDPMELSDDNSSKNRTDLLCLGNQSDEIYETTTYGPTLAGQRLEPVGVYNETICEIDQGEIMNSANPLELSNNASNEGVAEGDATNLQDALVNQVFEFDTSSTSCLPLVRKVLEPPEKTKAAPNPCALLSLQFFSVCHGIQQNISKSDVPLEYVGTSAQVSADQIYKGSSSAVTQDQGVQLVEKQNATPFEVAASESVQNVIISTAVSEIIHTVTAEKSTVDTLQDQTVQVVEKQSAFPFELAVSENVDTTRVALSNAKLHDHDEPDTSLINVKILDIDIVMHEESSEKLQNQDAAVADDQVALHVEAGNLEPVDTVNTLRSHVDVPPTENCQELHFLSIDETPRSNQPAFIGVESQNHNPERNSTGNVEIADTEVVRYESGCQSREDHEPQSNHLDMGSESPVAREINAEPSNSSQSNFALPQVAASTVEVPLQAGVQLRSAGSHLYGSNYIDFHINHQLASQNSPPSFASPLKHELENISKEIAQLQKLHEDKKAKLKSDCEREMQELIAQVNKKCDIKLQDAEGEFSLKKNGLDKNHNKVAMNHLLAEAFSSSCLDALSSWLPGIQQAIPSSSMQHRHQRPQHLVRHHPMAMARQLAHSRPIVAPQFQAMQQLMPPHSTRFARQDFVALPFRTTQHAAALSFGSASRPPIFSAVAPPANSRFGEETRFVTPYRGARAATFSPTTTFPSMTHLQQMLSPQHLQSPIPAMPPLQPPTSRNLPQLQGQPQLL